MATINPVDVIVLLSGGLDSAVCLALLAKEGKKTLALSFDYNQRHRVELEFAKKLTEHYCVEHLILKIDTQVFCRSGLVSDQTIPKGRTLDEIASEGFTTTYVPARNTIFLSFALGLAEMRGAKEVHYGPNAHDKFGFPDCSLDYVSAFQQVINLATKQSREGQAPKLIAPLIDMTKEEIWKKTRELNVPIELTLSCYDPTADGRACDECDACILRNQAV